MNIDLDRYVKAAAAITALRAVAAMRPRPHDWSAYRVPCPRCAVPAGVPCEDPAEAGDPRQMCIPGTGRRRRVPHGERIEAWTRAPWRRP
jgi:hypothetical protein